MGKIHLYTSLSGFLLMQEGVSFLAWTKGIAKSTHIHIEVPANAVRLARQHSEGLEFEVQDKQNW